MSEHSSEQVIVPIKRSFPVLVVAMVWLGVAIAGSLMLLRYSQAPGDSTAAPAAWPAASSVHMASAHSTLVLFMHPKCPCSRATVSELARLMAHCQGRVDAHVLFLQPDGMSQDWTESATWRSARAIPGVKVERDKRGVEAHRFGAGTSGDLVLYDAHGQLLFHGGITESRGHEGDNAGSEALQALILGTAGTGAILPASHPAYGCSLFECSAATAAAR